MTDLRHWIAMHAPEKEIGKLWNDIDTNHSEEFSSSVPWMSFSERYGFCLTEQIVRYIYADLMIAASEVDTSPAAFLSMRKEQRNALAEAVVKCNTRRLGGQR